MLKDTDAQAAQDVEGLILEALDVAVANGMTVMVCDALRSTLDALAVKAWNCGRAYHAGAARQDEATCTPAYTKARSLYAKAKADALKAAREVDRKAKTITDHRFVEENGG